MSGELDLAYATMMFVQNKELEMDLGPGYPYTLFRPDDGHAQ